MTDFSHLTRKIFMALEDIKAGRFVFVVAIKASEGSGGSIEDVITNIISDPQLALKHHCNSNGLTIEDRLCIPVILPLGLKAEDVRGFKSIRTKKAMWIEYANEGPSRA